ncbi:MAG: hypothetical protein JWL91_1913 [Sphingomonas bacterium]|nr:TorF family putative porin [Sphingomonas bacterium]MDB5690037.1 hypothetical protein [Sphingomonas bacterium]
MRPALAFALACVPTIAGAQAPRDIVTVEALSDLVERGLSATDGKGALRARIGGTVAGGFRLDASAATLRGSIRNGGADAGIDLIASYRAVRGTLSLDGGVTGRLYAGASGKLDYVELFGGASALIGPAEVGLTAAYAPDQASIGGDNLYLRARAVAAVIGTPISLTGHVGRSSGSVDDVARSARLRPDGTYHDWSVGAEYVRGAVTLGLSYTDSDVRPDRAPLPALARRSGARLIARAGLTF